MNAGKYQHISDQELLKHFYKDHNNEWLGILLQRYTLLLLGVCMKYLKDEDEAKDSAQQIFLKVITELQKYKVEFFKSWIYMVAKNHCLMKLRDKHGKIPAEINERLMATTEEDNESGELFHNDRAYELMGTALKELNPEQRQCVTLFYLHKKSYHEISKDTGYNMLQVKSYIQNGKRNLRIMIEKKLEDEGSKEQ